MKRLLAIYIGFLIVSLMFTGKSYAEIDTDTIVGIWLFDEGRGDIAQDSSVNGNDGTLNGPVWTSTSKFGDALEFNGADSYIEFATGESMKTQHLTFMAWFNTRKLDGYGHIFQTGNDWDDMAGYVFRVHQDGYAQTALAFASGNVATWLSGPALEADTWYHMVVSYDGTTAILYLNGENVASGDGQGEIMYDNQPVRIGVLSQTIGSAFDGFIDEAALFSEALEAEDIVAIMNNGLARVVGDQPFASRPDPEDGAMSTGTWATLSWRPGDLAASHDVYMGDNYDDVLNGTGDTFRGSYTDDFFVVGFPGYPFPDGLINGTTYYWRVDEANDANPDSPWKGPVWSFWVPSNKAYNLYPADRTMFVDPYVKLTWTAGFGAVFHTVYFGDDFNTVINATGGNPQTIVGYDPGPLEMDKTYYWRVDEFDGQQIYKGDVLSFTTTTPALGRIVMERWENIPGYDVPSLTNSPKYPNNPDVTELLESFSSAPALDQYGGRIHGWLYAPGTGDYTFWISSDNNGELWLSTDDDSANTRLIALESDWAPANTFGRGEEQSDPISLIAGNKYYIMAIWKEEDGGDQCQVAWQGPGVPERVIIPGGNLSPYEPLSAFGAKPTNGAVDVTQTLILEWKPGLQSASHEVYFGTDEDAVRNATKASPEYKGIKVLGDESYDPGELDWEVTYYWRIDEVNGVNPDSPWTGNVWNFTTADYLIIDDFESYDAGDNQIWYSWHDGLGYGVQGSDLYFAGNGTGAAVGDDTTPTYTEQNIVFSGSQSMPYWYNNNKQGYAFYSEAEKELSVSRDWTVQGLAELSIWFRGYPGSVGSFVEDPAGIYTMTGSGADIWTVDGVEADEFHYAFKTLSGTGSIAARVESISDTDPWAKAGVMIRETLDPDSSHAMMIVSSGSGISFQLRPGTGATSISDTTAGITAPYWVKIERDLSGNFSAYSSADGSTWQKQGVSQTIQMGTNVYIGLAVTAHNASATCQAVFTNVTITGQVGSQWANQDIGIATNDNEPLYVAVSNSAGTPAVVVHDDAHAATIDTWTEWVVPLQAFADQGIVLTDVDKIAIGLGTQGNMTVPGGSGKMFFDDIRLYRSREAAE
ncbi:MAG: LamG-like jellyroll fold domain-containing protein [Planctomycetota bacterium]